MGGFASIGECMIELSGNEGDQWRMGFAGDTLNTARYMRALMEKSYPVEYVTAFGEDSFSQKQRVFLTSNGIESPIAPLLTGFIPVFTQSRSTVPSVPSPIGGATPLQGVSPATAKLWKEA